MNINDGDFRPGELSPEEIRELTLAFFGGEPRPFKPFAIYDNQLRKIWAMIRDCSHTQTFVNGSFYILEDNYPEAEEDKYVGFEIHASANFLKAEGLVSNDRVDLNKVLDMIARRFPNTIPEVLICRSMVEKLESAQVELN